ncbi:hypothetical protein V6N12_012901 [Hibiscus sabdariffa]|uniref:Uncharacterized protein n=1 Tax=Hibiscus sabdariffa TaxID=183260 RepID=A0ABR2EI29_9ROSI
MDTDNTGPLNNDSDLQADNGMERSTPGGRHDSYAKVLSSGIGKDEATTNRISPEQEQSDRYGPWMITTNPRRRQNRSKLGSNKQVAVEAVHLGSR